MKVTIGKAQYEVTRNPGPRTSWRLAKPDGAVYDVEQGAERTVCNCGDFAYRHAQLPNSDGCKHVIALTALGMVRNVSPWDRAETACPAKPSVIAPRRTRQAVPRSIDWQEASELYGAGLRVAELATHYGLKRQTMHARLRRAGAMKPQCV